MTRRLNENAEPEWFFQDRAIDSLDDDRLDHRAVAATLVNAIRSAQPPCMIGLIAGFGKGKSSTANIARVLLGNDPGIDTVSVTADKHSGQAGARNLVHSIAAELERYREIRDDEVREILRPLRQSTQVSAADPTDTATNRFAEGRYSYKGLARSLLPFVVVAVVTALLAWIAGAELHHLLTIAAASPVLVWLAAMTFAGTDTPMGSLLTPATLTDQKPRAEAADEIEEVFGQLIDHHRSKRNRSLVIFVDDIDRLSKDDLLDALRSLRSLQSVPRGSEPVFVISCNEAVVRRAVGSSHDSPADLDGEGSASSAEMTDTIGSNDGSKVAVESAGDSGRADRPTGEQFTGLNRGTEVSMGGRDHDHPAVAFVDKMLTVRVALPPTMRGDMRRFASDLVGRDHPLRASVGTDIDRILTILVHDGVDDPRSVIRLLNGFVAGYLLGVQREAGGRVFTGDVTDHPDVLAQLTVLRDEFPDFFDAVVDNPLLLPAASKVSLRRRDLTASEVAAVDHSKAFSRADDSMEAAANTPGVDFTQPTLRRYLASTARLVRYPVDIGPLAYFTASPGGRLLGVELRGRLVSALRVGDPEELATVLQDVPSDQLDAAGAEVVDLISDAMPVDAPNLLAALAPNLETLGGAAQAVADAAADLLDRAPDERSEPEVLTALIDHAHPGRDSVLCERLVRHGDDDASTNNRLAHAGGYLADHPRIRDHVEQAVHAWATEMHKHGSWELSAPWLDVAERLDIDRYGALHRAVAVGLTRLIRAEQGFSEEDANRLVALVERTPTTDAAPRAGQLGAVGPNVESAVLRIYRATGYRGDAADASLVALAVKDEALPIPIRETAIELLAEWANEWKDATEAPDEDEDEPSPVAPTVLQALLSAVSQASLLKPVSTQLPRIAEALGERAKDLIDGVVTEHERCLEDGLIEQAEAVALDVIDGLREMSDTVVTPAVTRLLSPLASDIDPGSGAVQMAARLVGRIAGIPLGEQALGTAADSWSSGIRRAGGHDDRSRIEGFRALDRAAPALVEARAPQILSQLDAQIQSGDEPPLRLQNLATFPWPDEQLPAALRLLENGWDNVPSEAQLDVLDLATRAPDDLEGLSRFHDRLVAQVEAEPHGRASLIAANDFERLEATGKARVLAAAAGRHERITARLNESDDAVVAEALATRAEDETVARILNTLDARKRGSVAQRGLTTLTTATSVPESVVSILCQACDPAGLEAACSYALDKLPAANPIAESALRVVAIATEGGVARDDDRIDALVTEMLGDASPEVAGLLGRCTRGRRRLGTTARQTLEGMRELDATSEIVGAFDAARAT